MNWETSQWMLWGGALLACWRQVLAAVNRVRALFVVRVTVRGNLALALRLYAERNWRRLPMADRFVTSRPGYVRPLRRVTEVAWDMPPSQPAVFLCGRWPVMIGGLKGEHDLTPQLSILSLSALRGSVDADAVLAAALREFNDSQAGALSCGSRHFIRRVVGRGRSMMENTVMTSRAGGPSAAPMCEEELAMRFVARFIGWEEGDVGPSMPKKPMEGLALAPALQEAAVEFERWLGSRDWYQERLVPWRRGWLLHGRPGTGKTSFVRALAQQHDLPVWSYDLSTLSNEELSQEWQEMQECAPCIALFEDIDGVFHGRENVLRERGGSTLTFDCLLNCLSGIQTADGVFTVVTTNRLEWVDAALGIPDRDTGLSSRPGRLDRVIEVPPLSAAEQLAIVVRIVGDWPEAVRQAMEMLPEQATAAQVTECCVKLAQTFYWREAA